MKKVLLALSSALLITSVASVFGIESTEPAKSQAGMFEIMNKKDKSILITLVNGADFKFYQEEVKPFMGVVKQPIDTSKETKLVIYPNVGYSSGDAKIYLFPQGKNILVSYDPIFGLTPQSGKWRGLLSTTKSGINLSNNVKQDDIRKITGFRKEAKILYQIEKLKLKEQVKIEELKFKEQVKDILPYDYTDKAHEEDLELLKRVQ